MKSILYLLVFNFAFINTNAQNKAVPFEIAKQYFVRGDYPSQELHMLKIINEEKFNEIFGMANTMGKDGQPTTIDFSKNFVITLIDDVGNTTKSLSVKSLIKNDDQLQLAYEIKKREEPSSSSFRFCTIIIVDNKYLGTVSARMITEDDISMVGDDLDDKGCKPSTGHVWSILENKCILPGETKYAFRGEINYPLLFNKNGSKAEIIALNYLDKKYGQNLILTKKGKKWENGSLTLIETQKDNFVLKNKNKKIIKGELRK